MKDKTLNNMSEEQMLKEIIEKAVERGWKHVGMAIVFEDGVLKWNDRDWKRYLNKEEYIKHVFDHSFLIAYFGEKLIDDTLNGRNPRMGVGNRVCKINNWKHHAMHLVWSEDRIKYLHRFI